MAGCIVRTLECAQKDLFKINRAEIDPRVLDLIQFLVNKIHNDVQTGNVRILTLITYNIDVLKEQF